ncbi:MAG: Hsp20/alpha crystallin family protein [Gammaproteobacteria bacterium]|nr:Hsp20/alpha crystallin family protein [Gammaproteobacteria bacterium]
MGEVTSARIEPASALPRLARLDRWLRKFGWPSSFDLHATRADVIVRDEEVVVRAELPGFGKEDIYVSVNVNSVTIKASSETETKDEEGYCDRREIPHRTVSRRIRLPANVISEKARAQLKDGLLEVTIPRVVQMKRQHVKIES